MKHPFRSFALGRILLAGALAIVCLYNPIYAWSETSRDASVDKTPSAQTTPLAVESQSDTRILRDILVAMMHDDVNDTLVFKSVKITVTQGVVTLKGRLKSEKLKAKLIALVTTVVTADNVRDEIEVK